MLDTAAWQPIIGGLAFRSTNEFAFDTGISTNRASPFLGSLKVNNLFVVYLLAVLHSTGFSVETTRLKFLDPL